ncbi:MAG: SCP2 sterol-binding domain-containing protein [Alphaproteobacteria bacterium]
MPPVVLQPVLSAAMTAMKRCHPDIFERLADLGEPRYLIDPVDLPFVFLLRPDPEAPTLTAASDTEEVDATAAIRGPLLALIDLLEGRLDGDALFFSRDLVVEGDTEAVVALRNAVDGADIDLLSDVLSVLGPFSGPARVLAGGVTALFSRAAQDLETLRTAIIAPAIRRMDAGLRELDEEVSALKRQVPRGKGRRP